MELEMSEDQAKAGPIDEEDESHVEIEIEDDQDTPEDQQIYD